MSTPTPAQPELRCDRHEWTFRRGRPCPKCPVTKILASRMTWAERHQRQTWVREQMARLPGASRRSLAVLVASEVGCSELDAYTLCENAGWPR